MANLESVLKSKIVIRYFFTNPIRNSLVKSGENGLKQSTSRFQAI